MYVCINSVRHDHMWPHGPDRFCVVQSRSGIVMPVTFELCQLLARLRRGIVPSFVAWELMPLGQIWCFVEQAGGWVQTTGNYSALRCVSCTTSRMPCRVCYHLRTGQPACIYLEGHVLFAGSRCTFLLRRAKDRSGSKIPAYPAMHLTL